MVTEMVMGSASRAARITAAVLALVPSIAQAMQVTGLEEERLVAGPAPAFVIEHQRLATTSSGGVTTTSSPRRQRWRTDAYRIALDSPNAADPRTLHSGWIFGDEIALMRLAWLDGSDDVRATTAIYDGIYGYAWILEDGWHLEATPMLGVGVSSWTRSAIDGIGIGIGNGSVRSSRCLYLEGAMRAGIYRTDALGVQWGVDARASYAR